MESQKPAGELPRHDDRSTALESNPSSVKSDRSGAVLAGRSAEIAADLTKFQVRTLAIVAGGDRYGLAIKEELEAYYNEDVNHGRLYSNLDELVDRDLVEKSQRDKRTNNYSITELGRRVLQHEMAWLDSQSNGGGSA